MWFNHFAIPMSYVKYYYVEVCPQSIFLQVMFCFAKLLVECADTLNICLNLGIIDMDDPFRCAMLACSIQT